MNTIKNNYICKICDKQFIFEKHKMDHESLCEARCELNFVNKNKDFIKIKRQPLHKDVYEIIKQLQEKVERLENKVRKLELREPKNKSVDEYLNENNIIPTITFNKWIYKIDITEEHLDKLYEDSPEDAYKAIFKPILKNLMDEDPIKAFTAKKGIYYVYDENKWRIMDENHLSKIVLYLNKEFINVFVRWVENNKEAINSSERKTNEKIEKMALISSSRIPDCKKINLIKDCFKRFVPEMELNI